MDTLDRLFTELVKVLRDARAEYLARPFDVAELIAYVPYRAVRGAIGADTNDDYAHTLTRLLAGERGYLFADELLQDDLKAELASPNPNLAAYRSYLNARVQLAQEHVRSTLDALRAAAEPGAELSALGALLERVAAPDPVAAALEPVVAAAPRPHLDPRTPDARAVDAPKRSSRPGCKYCGQPLPEGRDVHFCPHCGQNLLVRRCAACSSEIETGWKFCVTCGRAAP